MFRQSQVNSEMNAVLLHLQIFYILFVLEKVKTEITTHHIKVFNGFSATDNDDERSAASRLECVNSCLNIEKCIAIRYRADTKACLIIYRQILSYYEKPGEYQVIMVRSAPGVQVQKNIDTDYEYTSSEAAYVCTLLGSRLMTLDELQHLFDDGYTYCSCGWLAGGIRKYVMQTMADGCGNTVGLVDCDWADTANAWCMPN